MKETGIIFTPDNIRAIIEGRKTQTRRVVKPQPSWVMEKTALIGNRAGMQNALCPYGVPGDHLWVRETFIAGWPADDGYLRKFDDKGNERPKTVWYRATPESEFMWLTDDGSMTDIIPWKPSIFMPRWASRIMLEITDVRVQRLQDISKVDALAEGISVLPLQSVDDPTAWYQSTPGNHQARSAEESYAKLWDSINRKTHPWSSNPWVWAITFKRLVPNPLVTTPGGLLHAT